MSNYKKIIDNLRDEPNYQNLMIVEAADAIEAQAARIAELEAALKAALRYIENTEDELGIELDCRFAARAALEKDNAK